MPRNAFLSNIREILTYAIVGTTLNALSIGTCLWLVNTYIGFPGMPGAENADAYTIIVFMLFGSIVSAVDPVAVIAVFDEIHVNVTLYILVFGESLLNDGVAVVLYQMFEEFIYLGNENINATNIALAIASFFVVALGGSFIGFIFGYVTAFASKYTDCIRSLEPLIVLGLAYISYLLADMLKMSAILSVVMAGFVMRYYVEHNMSEETLHAIHAGTKLLSVISEMTIFVILGLVAAISNWQNHFDWAFSLTSLLFCSIFRPLFTILLTWILNYKRTRKISWKDMFIMSFSGLRGGIAFSLVSLSNIDHAVGEDGKESFILTTIFIVFFTSFIQGTLCGPLVNLFGIDKAQDPEENEYKVSTMMHDKVLRGVFFGAHF